MQREAQRFFSRRPQRVQPTRLSQRPWPAGLLPPLALSVCDRQPFGRGAGGIGAADLHGGGVLCDGQRRCVGVGVGRDDGDGLGEAVGGDRLDAQVQQKVVEPAGGSGRCCDGVEYSPSQCNGSGSGKLGVHASVQTMNGHYGRALWTGTMDGHYGRALLART